MKHRQVEAETARHVEPEESRRAPGDGEVEEVEEVEDQVMRSREESCVVCRSWRGREAEADWGAKVGVAVLPGRGIVMQSSRDARSSASVVLRRRF